MVSVYRRRRAAGHGSAAIAPRPPRGLSAGSLREPPRRISRMAAAPCQATPRSIGRDGLRRHDARDAPWSGRRAPVRSASVRYPCGRPPSVPVRGAHLRRPAPLGRSLRRRRVDNRRGGDAGGHGQTVPGRLGRPHPLARAEFMGALKESESLIQIRAPEALDLPEGGI